MWADFGLIAAIDRTVEDYDSMAGHEMTKTKQEKAMMSVSLRSPYRMNSQRIDDLRTSQARSKVPQ